MSDYLPPAEQQSPAVPVVPHSREAEEATVGSVLINPEAYYDILSIVGASDFYIIRLRWIFESFARLTESRQPIDMLTVADDLERKGMLAEIGGPSFLTALVNQVPTSLNAEAYARIIKGHAIRRHLIAAANQIASLAYDTETGVDDISEKAYAVVEKAIESPLEKQMHPIREIMSDQYDRVDDNSRIDDEDKQHLRTELADVDSLLRIRAGNLVVVAGRPGIGKTGFALTVLSNIALHQNKNIALFSLEMDNAEIADRLSAQETGINLTNITDGKLEESDWPKFAHAVEVLSDSHVFINDDPDITIPQMRALCKKIQARHGLDVIFVDYLGLMSAPGDNAVERVTYISRELKKLAKALGIPVIALHQMNREIERRGDGEPILSDLRDSGSVEQDSDAVLFLYQKGEWNEKSKMNIVNGKLAKQRNGPKGKMEFMVHTQTTKFNNSAVSIKL